MSRHLPTIHMTKQTLAVLAIALLAACDRQAATSPRRDDSAPSSTSAATLVTGTRTLGPLTDSVWGTLRETKNPLVVVVLDSRGIPVRGVAVTWTAFGGGIVSPMSPVTDAGGEVAAEYQFGWEARSGYGATAAVEGLAGSPVVFELSAHAATPTRIEKTRGDTLTVAVGKQVVYTVTARDSYGNPTRGVRIEWTVPPGTGSLSRALTYTGRDGRAEVTRTLGPQLGTQTATATAPGLRSAPNVIFTTYVREP
jgi:hypothetical protein